MVYAAMALVPSCLVVALAVIDRLRLGLLLVLREYLQSLVNLGRKSLRRLEQVEELSVVHLEEHACFGAREERGRYQSVSHTRKRGGRCLGQRTVAARS